MVTVHKLLWDNYFWITVTSGRSRCGKPRGTPRELIQVRKKGSFQKSPFSRDSREFRDSKDFREPQTVEKKGESDHFVEILENLEILEFLEIPPVKRPLL